MIGRTALDEIPKEYSWDTEEIRKEKREIAEILRKQHGKLVCINCYLKTYLSLIY